MDFLSEVPPLDLWQDLTRDAKVREISRSNSVYAFRANHEEVLDARPAHVKFHEISRCCSQGASKVNFNWRPSFGRFQAQNGPKGAPVEIGP